MKKVFAKQKSADESFEKTSGRTPEIAVLCLYCVLVAVIMIFHEPWFDEAQAWMIGKNASYWDILFKLPHYEGHPPLWQLILSIPAKLGVPYEYGIKGVNLLISAAAVFMILFKSPFKRIIRVTLPFTYFIFYQYGVISRPYMLMLLIFCFMAVSYRKRNEKPFVFVAFMMLMCFTNAYGIVLCGGIAIAWIIEIWNKRNVFEFLKALIRDKRFYALLTLLAWAVVNIYLIMPYSDTFRIDAEEVNSLLIRLLYTIFALPVDCCFTDLLPKYGALKQQLIPIESLASGVVCGIAVLAFVCLYLYKRKKLLTFAIPYLMLGTFSAVVYIHSHHTGITFLFLIFCFWISGDEKETRKVKLLKEREQELVNGLFAAVLGVSLIIPIYWSTAACVNEITGKCGAGRDISEFIRENNLEDYNIMTGWVTSGDDYSGDNTDFFNVQTCISVLPYYDENVFSNFHSGSDEDIYMTCRVSSVQENEQRYKEWAQSGYPDVLVGVCSVSRVFPELTMEQYAPVFKFDYGHAWKNRNLQYHSYIYVKRDLLQETNLIEIEVE